MTTEFNELLPVPHGDKAQVWIVGTREQVTHLINEFYVKRIASDPCGICEAARVSFTPIIPAPFASGKYMSVLGEIARNRASGATVYLCRSPDKAN